MAIGNIQSSKRTQPVLRDRERQPRGQPPRNQDKTGKPDLKGTYQERKEGTIDERV